MKTCQPAETLGWAWHMLTVGLVVLKISTRQVKSAHVSEEHKNFLCILCDFPVYSHCVRLTHHIPAEALWSPRNGQMGPRNDRGVCVSPTAAGCKGLELWHWQLPLLWLQFLQSEGSKGFGGDNYRSFKDSQVWLSCFDMIIVYKARWSLVWDCPTATPQVA